MSEIINDCDVEKLYVSQVRSIALIEILKQKGIGEKHKSNERQILLFSLKDAVKRIGFLRNYLKVS